MKKTFLLTFILFSQKSLSYVVEQIPIICGDQKISYSYVNGINTEKLKSKESADLLTAVLKTKKPVYPIYNQSQGVFLDLMKCIAEKLEEKNVFVKIYATAWKFFNFKFIDNRDFIKSKIEENKKDSKYHIVFSHSQGNLYTNIACKDLRRYEDPFINIQIASPTSEVLCGSLNDHITINEDELYKIMSNSLDLAFLKSDGNDVFNNYIDVLTTLNMPMNPPMKHNVVQPNLKTPFLSFSHHSIENYLTYKPSLNLIKRVYERNLNKIKPPPFLLKNNSLIIDCSNINQYTSDDLPVNGLFTVFGRTFQKTDYNEFRIVKIEEGEYLLVKEFKLIYFSIVLVLAILLAPFALKMIGEAMENEARRREEEERRKGLR